MVETESSLLDSIDSERLMRHTRTIAQWERLSGSEDERKAFDYIERELEAYGFQCQRYHPVCYVSLPQSAKLVIVGEDADIPCITHSFSPSTPANGLELELIDGGSGRSGDFAEIDARRKAVLTEGLATPNTVAPAEAAGAAAVIHNSGPQMHEMTISPVWGNPTPNTLGLMPRIPHISVDEEGTTRLRNALSSGTAKVRIVTSVDTGWRPLPVLVADLTHPGSMPTHVLLSGHVDSWYYGAMDNGSANASMLECARILGEHRSELRHGLRIAFWSGHSHARYATSAWYADEFWSLTHHYCLAHVNIDSPGGIGATDLSSASTMAETWLLARQIFGDVAGAELRYDRIGRLGDQSFWGAGVPSFYCSISQQPEQETPTGIGALLGRGGGLGWWWHTRDDTVDKIDPAFLARDARILLATVFRLCHSPVLKFDQAQVAEEVLETLRSLQLDSESDLDLSNTIELAERLKSATERLRDFQLDEHATDDEIALYNGCVTGVSRILIPVNYTVSGEFEQDPAVPAEPLPGLQPARQLARRRGTPESYYPWLTRLRRERNRLEQALSQAEALIQQTLAVFEMPSE